MPFATRAYVEIYWIPPGVGGTGIIGGSVANTPGYGQPQTGGTMPNAQMMRFQAAEAIPGGNSPSLANINTALTNIANDLAGSTGTPQITAAILAQIQNWATGTD